MDARQPTRVHDCGGSSGGECRVENHYFSAGHGSWPSDQCGDTGGRRWAEMPDNNGCTTTTQVTAPKVTVHKAVDRPQVHVGETIRWTLTVKNEGDGPTTGAVTLTDTLPEHLTDIVVEPSAPATCAAVQGRE